MSADFRTAHYKGFEHDGATPYLHVTHAGDQEYKLGDFSLADLAELADMAGQAWPGRPGVEVRFVIEARMPGKPWVVMWSALAGDGTGEVTEEFAAAAFEGLSNGRMQWRLVRRTILTADQVLAPETRAPVTRPVLDISDVKTCGCGVRIFFAMTGGDKPMPVVYDSAWDPAGTLAVWRDGATLRCQVLKKTEREQEAEVLARLLKGLGRVRYQSHFADCRDAAQHRKAR